MFNACPDKPAYKHRRGCIMNNVKINKLKAEDYMISKVTLTFLVTPLVFLVLTGAMIAA